MARPGMGEKTIIGVPVLPGFAPFPSHVTVDVEDSGSDIATSEPEVLSQRSVSVSSVPGATARYLDSQHLAASGQRRWKLRHVDFMPRLLKEKTMADDEYEKFPVLWRRSNAWLQEHPYALLFSCETVTWLSVDKQLFSDNGLLTKSMATDKKTRFTRGIRLWYFTDDDTFYEKKTLPPPCKFGYLNYVPEGKNDSMQNMLKRLNADLKTKPVAGIILRVESLSCLQDVADADTAVWWEQPSKDRSFFTFFRIYFTEFPEDKQEYGEITIRDFVPRQDQRTVHNSGYEPYGEAWTRTARWLYTHPQHQCVNIQSVFVKLKKDATETEMVDRVYYMEHGSAHSSISSTKTEYLQIVRLIYCTPPNREAPEHGLKMAYKAFYPQQLKRAKELTEDDAPESGYEDLKQTEDRLNSWLVFSGARMVGVETVPVRLKTGGQETLGSEATFVTNGREKNFIRELWRNNIRIYMEGEFREVPTVWSRQLVDTGNVPPPKE